MLAEAEKRDHRRLGNELDLFSFPEEIGSGLAVFHPKGGIVRQAMEDYSRRRHTEEGYEFVYSPHLTKAALFETSGHLQWYAEGMFPPLQLDEERDEQGNIKRQAQDYYLKPMNCPGHVQIFNAGLHSYRDLPLRFGEFGACHRNEPSGALHGIMRVRGFTQDDGHIFCTPAQIQSEVANFIDILIGVYRDFGFQDIIYKLSTRPPKRVGDDATWDIAEKALADALDLELNSLDVQHGHGPILA